MSKVCAYTVAVVVWGWGASASPMSCASMAACLGKKLVVCCFMFTPSICRRGFKARIQAGSQARVEQGAVASWGCHWARRQEAQLVGQA